MKFILARGLVLLFLMMVSVSVMAEGWVGAGAPCVRGGWGLGGGGVGADTGCGWKASAGSYFGIDQSIEVRAGAVTEMNDGAYVPISGLFELKIYWCSFPLNMDTCSKSNGTLLLSGGVVYLTSGIPLRKQSIVANSAKMVSPSAGGYCITLSDVSSGYEYSGNLGYGPGGRGMFCGDVYKLSVEPSRCIFNNGGSDMDVKLGQQLRTDIAVKPGITRAMEKDIIITCSGNTDYNADMKLEYTPISVSGTQVVSSSTKGLGVAVLYKGKAIQQGDSFPMHYQPGINTLTLGFEAVRDPAMALGDLKTGNFTANAVLIFTEQ